MTVDERLTNEASLDPTQIATVRKETTVFLRSKLGDDAVEKIIAAIPTLSKVAYF